MYKLLLCVRYLRTRFIALASIISVMLGVATMIVVNSVMSGFGTEMRNRIHAILSDVVVETNSLNGVHDSERWMQIIREVGGDDIDSMAAMVEIYGMMTYDYRGQSVMKTVQLVGIDPMTRAKVSPDVGMFQTSLDSYQSIKEHGQVVREPLRLPVEPPSWNLTAEAMEYRRHHIKLQQEYIEKRKWEQGRTQPEAEASDDDAPTAAENPFADPVPSTALTDKTPDFSTGHQTVVEADPAAPQPARLYCGAGLIEFVYYDEETKQSKVMRIVRPGDDVMISTISAGRPEPVRFHATVVDVFKSGMSEYDSNLVFCNLEELQKVRGMIDPETKDGAITSIQIKLKNYDRSAEVVRRLQAALPPGLFSVRTWEQKQGPLLAAVEIEKAILNVLLFLIITVAGFGILAIFYMIVVEKTRDIGILKALGASSRGVMTIFLSYGLALGVVGSGVGVAIGLLFVHYIDEIEHGLSQLTGRKIFDETIYYFPNIPTDVSPVMVVWVALAAVTIAVMASVLPARRAARLHPVEALRYE
ncbi:MAG: ABC transporter permease [Planctomycetaceae bacterium]